jgi:hypothetical protein
MQGTNACFVHSTIKNYTAHSVHQLHRLALNTLPPAPVALGTGIFSFLGAAVLLLAAVAMPLVIFPITPFFAVVFFVFTTVVPVEVSLLELTARPRPAFGGTGGGAITVAATGRRPRSDPVGIVGCFLSWRDETCKRCCGSSDSPWFYR